MNTAILSSLPLSAEIYTVHRDKEDLGDLKLKFAVMADLHLVPNENSPEDVDNVGKGNGIEDFFRATAMCKDENVDFAAVCGDIVHSGRSDLALTQIAYNSILDANEVDFPIYCVAGNHDQGLDAEQWRSLTSCDLNYTIENDAGRFVFLSLKHIDAENGGNQQAEPFDQNALDCLQNALSADDGKMVHVFMHFPLNALRPTPQFAGLGELHYPNASGYFVPNSNKYDAVHSEGFAVAENVELAKVWENAQCTQILDMMKAYKGTVIAYSGHTHFACQVEQSCPNVMVAQAAQNVWTVHAPSLNYPRDRDRKVIAQQHPTLQPSQCWLVECYAGFAKLSCIELNMNCSNGSEKPLKSVVISA